MGGVVAGRRAFLVGACVWVGLGAAGARASQTPLAQLHRMVPRIADGRIRATARTRGEATEGIAYGLVDAPLGTVLRALSDVSPVLRCMPRVESAEVLARSHGYRRVMLRIGGSRYLGEVQILGATDGVHVLRLEAPGCCRARVRLAATPGRVRTVVEAKVSLGDEMGLLARTDAAHRSAAIATIAGLRRRV